MTQRMVYVSLLWPIYKMGDVRALPLVHPLQLLGIHLVKLRETLYEHDV